MLLSLPEVVVNRQFRRQLNVKLNIART